MTTNRILTIRLISLCLIFCAIGSITKGQSKLPMVRANAKTVSIRDGLHLKKDYWVIMPEKKPDYYYLEIPEKDQTITFITDMDSISFKMTYGKVQDFIILLNGKDSCYTRISATYRDPNTITKIQVRKGPDTIPFTLGDNRKMYVSAILNGSHVKNIQLDLGAGGTVINSTSVNKVKINFDGKVNLANSDGIHQVPSASKNQLQIGGLQWDSISIAVAENMKPHEDLIIGNYLFKGKVLEMNYDKGILVVHDSLPKLPSSYSRHEVILEGGVLPHIKVNLQTAKESKTGWALFDTGARTSIINEDEITMPYRILAEIAGMVGLGQSLTPKLNIDHHQLSGFEFKTRDMGDDDQLRLILGNDLLKRFNVILDNRNGNLYLQPNSLQDQPYGRRDEYYVVRAIVVIFFLILAIVIIWKRKKKKKNKNTKP